MPASLLLTEIIRLFFLPESESEVFSHVLSEFRRLTGKFHREILFIVTFAVRQTRLNW